jgi:phenylacetic acid degradation operon negative regulatory protein
MAATFLGRHEPFQASCLHDDSKKMRLTQRQWSMHWQRRYRPGVTIFIAAPGGGETRLPQPRALIVTIYGLYARGDAGQARVDTGQARGDAGQARGDAGQSRGDASRAGGDASQARVDADYAGRAGGWLSVASLIQLMGGLGADQAAVRSSISRLKQRGILEPLRLGGAAGYALSRRGREILAEGDRRIFERPRARLADGWLLAVFSVPERERGRRHALRSRLSWLGFGTVSAGVWIAPAHLAAETTEVLARYGLSGYVDLFSAGYLAFGDVREQVGRWWDLDRLEGLYQEFLDSSVPLLESWRGRSTGRAGGDGEAAFADYVLALTAWRRLPFLDPGLPAQLLPADWHGLRAARTFAALRARLADPACAYVLAVTAQPPGA